MQVTHARSSLHRVRFVVLLRMTAAAAASRLLPHPPNLMPIGAIALLGGACFVDRRAAFAVPLGAMLASNVVLARLRGHPWLVVGPMQLVIYGSFATIVCLGFLLRRRRRALPIAGVTLASSALYFVATNLGVWALGALYPRNVRRPGRLLRRCAAVLPQHAGRRLRLRVRPLRQAGPDRARVPDPARPARRAATGACARVTRRVLPSWSSGKDSA